jgi:hypothetical protein
MLAISSPKIKLRKQFHLQESKGGNTFHPLKVQWLSLWRDSSFRGVKVNKFITHTRASCERKMSIPDPCESEKLIPSSYGGMPEGQRNTGKN